MARKDALLRLHKTLLNRRTELRRRLGMEMQDLGHVQIGGTSGDSADAAFDSASEEVASHLAELESRELEQIEYALYLLRVGKYGLCEACGCRIPVARLNALPFTALCVPCQREAERNGGWQRNHQADWERVSDSDSMDDKPVNLNDIEMDMTK